MASCKSLSKLHFLFVMDIWRNLFSDQTSVIKYINSGICKTKKTYFELNYIPLVSGIIFIRYAHTQKIGKPNNWKVFARMKTNGQGRQCLGNGTDAVTGVRKKSNHHFYFHKRQIRASCLENVIPLLVASSRANL